MNRTGIFFHYQDGERLRDFPAALAGDAFYPQKPRSSGEYGDLGLTAGCHARVAREPRRAADELSSGRLIVVLCGGSRRDLARQIILRLIAVLCE